jgi:hypothetical protein
VVRSLWIALFCMVTASAHLACAQDSDDTKSVTISDDRKSGTISDDPKSVTTSDDPKSVTMVAKVGGESYESAGPGNCRHTPTAAIYGVPAALWMVGLTGSENDAIKSMNLTLWKPKNGSPQQFSLNLSAGSSTHKIDVGGRGEQVGSGKASVVAAGAGGRIEISGKDDSGKSIELVVRCPVFAGVEAEGG